MKKIFTLTMLVMAFAITVNAQAPKKFWDFRHWSAETVENLKADAAWTDIEKAADSEPTAISKDNCFWEVGASGSAEGAVVTANGTPIKELEGLLNLNTKARSMAIAVNYGDCTPTNGDNFGPYNGPSYLWFGGKNLNYLVIPSVKPGETIKIGVESHKLSDARGVQLFVGRGNSGTKLMGPDGTDPGYPKTYEEKEWLLPADGLADEPNADGTYDITLRNNNGCHIYFIQVGDGENKKTEVAYIHNGDISEDIAYNTIKANENYNVTAIDVAGDISAITAESLQAYDATVISSSVPADNAIAPVLKSAMPWTPILNLNADLYAAWGYGEKAVSADGIISVLKDKSSVFAGLTFIEDESMPGIKGLFVPSYNGVKLGDYFANDDILGVDLFTEGITAIHAHNAGHNAYLYLPFSAEALAGIDEITMNMLNNALEFVAGSKSEITQTRKPTFELEYKDLNTNVTIKNTNPKAQIYYTLDGTEPTTASTLYTEPFNLTAEATVKAVAIAEGYLLSDVAEQLVEMKRQAKAPVVSLNTEDGKTTVTITSETEGANIWYNYTASADSTKSTKYTGPITVTTGKTITTFAVSDVFVQSELTTEQIVIKNAKVRIDVLAHMDANSAEFNGGSTSTKYFFSWGKDKNAYTWYDETSDPIIVKDQFGEDSLAGYTKLNPEEVVDFNNGWAIRSRGHVIIWENMKPGKNIGDGSSYNPATADDLDTLVTNAYLNIGEWNTANPRNGIIYTTQKFKGPFDVVSFISNGNSGGSPQIAFEVATDTIEGTEWTQIGDLCVLAGQRLYKKFTVSYEGTDEVFVRTRIADGNSKAGFYDIYIMNEGEKSKAYKQQLDEEYANYATGIECIEKPTTSNIPAGIYNINGMRINSLQRGLNIVKMGDGTIKKVMVK